MLLRRINRCKNIQATFALPRGTKKLKLGSTALPNEGEDSMIADKLDLMNGKVRIFGHGLAIAIFLLTVDLFLSCFVNFFPLDETGVMYFLSTIPQVVAAFAGLTIAGYSVAESALQRQAEEDESLKQIIEDMHGEFRQLLIQIIIVSILDIAISVFGIAAYSCQTGENDFLFRFVLNGSAILMLALLVFIVILVVKMSDSNNIENVSDAAIEMINQKAKAIDRDTAYDSMQHDVQNRFNPVGGKGNEGSSEKKLASFLQTFNQLSDLLTSAARKAGYKSEREYIPTMSAARYLIRAGYIPEGIADQLFEIIRYRNYLVHGASFVVSSEMLEALSDVVQIIDSALQKKTT